MRSKIINLEINEVSPTLIEEYIKNNSNSNLAKLINEARLKIYTTKALDIPKDKLYPSQTWASFNTGKPYKEHKCYWYSDSLNTKNLIWNKLVSKDKSVGILGSIHSSKYPEDLLSNENYKFYLPDCFGSKDITKPTFYKYFQSFNNSLVGGSSRVTAIKSLIKVLFRNLTKIIIFPKKYGISLFSIKMILAIIYFSLRYKNKEILRMAQFPLIASIFLNEVIKKNPSYSTLFSNHIAGNMHRYWYAYDISSFKNKNKYSKKWIKRNKKLIYLGLDFVDNLIGLILNKKELKENIILITSSMGQEANPKFDNKFLAKYDGKIKNIELFLKKFADFHLKKYGKCIEFECTRNMAPQYGLKVKNDTEADNTFIANSISSFLETLGLAHKIDQQDKSIVLSIDPYTDKNLQENYDISEARDEFSNYGFEFFLIEDHHSGSHCENGSLVVINECDSFKKQVNKYIEKEGYINYLNFSKIITEFL